MASLRPIFGVSGAVCLACTLLFAANQAGCQAQTRTFVAVSSSSSSGGTGGTTGQGGAPATSSTSTSSGSGTSSTSGAGGSGGSAPVCMTSMRPYAGPLCGSATVPCTVHIDEILPNDAASRDDAPGIALEAKCAPRIGFSVSGTPFQGFYAFRDGANPVAGIDAGGGGNDAGSDGGTSDGGDGGTPYTGPWTVENPPFGADTVGVAIAPGGSPMAVADDGSENVTLWSRGTSGWAKVEQVPGMLQFWADGLGVDNQGNLHATFGTSTGTLDYGVYANGWAVTPLTAPLSGDSPLAISPTGVAQFSYWTPGVADGGVSGLAWATATSLDTPEIVWQAAIGNTSHAIAVTPADSANPDGVPHILFLRAVAGSTTGANEIVYTTRTKATQWTATSLDQESATNMKCPLIAPGAGDVCNFNYDELQPLAVVSSTGGDVRFIYEKYHYQGSATSACIVGGILHLCTYRTTTDTSTGQIFVASVDAATGVTTVSVVKDVMAGSGTAIVDPLGRIHLAVYDSYPPSQGGTTVRYFQLAP